MLVVVCFPTINAERASHACERWHAQGYCVAVGVEGVLDAPADWVVRTDAYPGYWQSCNNLSRLAVQRGADVVVCIGDDMDPDPTRTAAQLGAEYLARFPDGLGIMQPTGDPMSGTDQMCGSPWMGRGWIERAYQGRGAYWPEYRQFYGDEELKLVSERLGLLWMRPDVTQWHHHWARGGEFLPYHRRAIDTWWRHDEDLFNGRLDQGFPGSEIRR